MGGQNLLHKKAETEEEGMGGQNLLHKKAETEEEGMGGQGPALGMRPGAPGRHQEGKRPGRQGARKARGQGGRAPGGHQEGKTPPPRTVEATKGALAPPPDQAAAPHRRGRPRAPWRLQTRPPPRTVEAAQGRRPTRPPQRRRPGRVTGRAARGAACGAVHARRYGVPTCDAMSGRMRRVHAWWHETPARAH